MRFSGWEKAIAEPVCPGSNGSIACTRHQFKLRATRVVHITDDILSVSTDVNSVPTILDAASTIL